MKYEATPSPPKSSVDPVLIGNYGFRFQVNASSDYYEPAGLTVSRENLKTLVEAHGFLQGRRRVEALLRVEFHETIPSLVQTDFYPEILGAALGETGKAQRLDSEGVKSVYENARAYLKRLEA